MRSALSQTFQDTHACSRKVPPNEHVIHCDQPRHIWESRKFELEMDQLLEFELEELFELELEELFELEFDELLELELELEFEDEFEFELDDELEFELEEELCERLDCECELSREFARNQLKSVHRPSTWIHHCPLLNRKRGVERSSSAR